jgi:hypothetical protein
MTTTLNAPALLAAEEVKKPTHGGFDSNIDPILLAYYYISQAAITAGDTAILHAKGMEANARMQQNLNSREARLNWINVPKENVEHKTISNKHTDWKHWHWTWSKMMMEPDTYYTYQHVTIVTNLLTVQAALQANQVLMGQRQIVEKQLTVLSEQARGSASTITTITNQSMQSIQAGGYVIQIFRSLTYAALMRKPPRLT